MAIVKEVKTVKKIIVDHARIIPLTFAQSATLESLCLTESVWHANSHVEIVNYLFKKSI